MNKTLKVVFEDKEIIVFLKPVGIQSEGEGETVAMILKEYWQNEQAYVGLVHRLDTNTAGLMVVAKTPFAAKELSKQIQDGEFQKIYLAAVEGHPEKTGAWQDYLFKDSRKNKVFTVKTLRKGAKEAKLTYEILARAENEKGAYSLAEIALETGRTHQIRAQFASRGFPLMGDGKYGSKDNKAKNALFSHRLTFKHPKTKKEMHFIAYPKGEEYPWSLFGDEWKGER